MSQKVNNVMSKKRDQTAQRIVKAIKESKGRLTIAATKARLSYMTLWRYTQDYPSVKQAVEEAKESQVDHTEGKLFERIDKGDTTAIIFHLKTQGKKRGYVERQEIETPSEIKINVRYVKRKT